MSPDLVRESGREGMAVGDRVGLLRADLMREPFLGITDMTIAATTSIHDLKVTICAVRGAIGLYESACALGQSDETLTRGADLVLSPVECLVLAWRRGGHREYVRVVRAQRRPQS